MSREYKNLNIIEVNYGFGWAREGDPSTYPISMVLEQVDKEVGELREHIRILEEKLNEK